MPSSRELDNWFTYHAADEAQRAHYEAIRQAGRAMAQCIVEHTPPCADQTVAVRKLREVVMIANAAIACHDGAV